MGVFDVDRRPDSHITQYGLALYPMGFLYTRHSCGGHTHRKCGSCMNVIKADLQDHPKPSHTFRWNARQTKDKLKWKGFKKVMIDSANYNPMLARRGGVMAYGGSGIPNVDGGQVHVQQTDGHGKSNPVARQENIASQGVVHTGLNEFVHY